MSAAIIDGKALAASIRASLKLAVAKLPRAPGLATVLVGDNLASAIYVRNKLAACTEIGINGQLVELPANVGAAELFSQLQSLNEDERIHGILLQLPLPQQLDENEFINIISADRDVDGLGAVNYGLMAAGQPSHIPCTPLGCLKLIQSVRPQLAGLRAVVIGRSRLVGRPMAELLMQQNCTVTIAHSKTADIASITREADIVVAAVGKPQLVKANWIKPGATVIDVGINRVDGKVVGDVDFENVKAVAGAISPVPGGAGPMTVAMLMANTVRSAYQRAALPLPEALAV